MRSKFLVLAGVLGLYFCGSAQAQQTGNLSTALTGVNPANLSSFQVPVPNPAIPAISAYKSPSTLLTWFRAINPFSSSSTMQGSSNIPAPQYSNVFQPVAPIMMTIQR